jgi:hypothetical protein
VGRSRWLPPGSRRGPRLDRPGAPKSKSLSPAVQPARRQPEARAREGIARGIEAAPGNAGGAPGQLAHCARLQKRADPIPHAGRGASGDLFWRNADQRPELPGTSSAW